MSEAPTLAAGGLVIALPATWALGRLIESQLFGVRPSDAVTVVVASSVLLLVSLAAGALPARKIGSRHPVDALRSD